MVRTINVTFSPVDLSLGTSKESVSSVAVIPQEDGYLELSFIHHTLMQSGLLTGWLYVYPHTIVVGLGRLSNVEASLPCNCPSLFLSL